MDSVKVTTETTRRSIPTEHREAAARYIAEIARRDPLAFLGPEYEAERVSELWDRFVDAYRAASSGAYARHGRDAVRIALARL
jgi:hypothetical protein